MYRGDKDTSIELSVLGPARLGGRPRIGLSTGLSQLLILSVLLSVIVHLYLALLFMGFLGGGEAAERKQPARLKPESVTNVELWGEVPHGRASNMAEPPAEAPAPQSVPPEALEEIPQVPLDAIALGPKAEPTPPPLKRTQTPPPKPVEVKVKKAPPQPKPAVQQAPKTRNGLSASRHRIIGSPDAQKDSEVTKYFNQFLEKVQRRWVSIGISVATARPQVWYRVAIGPSGRITSVIVLQPSGNPYFDRSVEVAIRGVSTLPPLPASFGGKMAVAEFGFSLGGWR